MYDRIEEIIADDSNNFEYLAHKFLANPKHAFRRTDLSGLDLRLTDITNFDLAGSHVNKCIVDHWTKFNEEIRFQDQIFSPFDLEDWDTPIRNRAIDPELELDQFKNITFIDTIAKVSSLPFSSLHIRPTITFIEECMRSIINLKGDGNSKYVDRKIAEILYVSSMISGYYIRKNMNRSYKSRDAVAVLMGLSMACNRIRDNKNDFYNAPIYINGNVYYFIEHYGSYDPLVEVARKASVHSVKNRSRLVDALVTMLSAIGSDFNLHRTFLSTHLKPDS